MEALREKRIHRKEREVRKEREIGPFFALSAPFPPETDKCGDILLPFLIQGPRPQVHG
jgi:hypothetical protein